MSLLLPVDDNGNPLQVLGFAREGTIKLQVTDVSVRTDLPLSDGIELVTLIATGPCRFVIGDATVIANLESSPFLYPGIYVDVPVRRGEDHMAIIAESEPCFVYVLGRG